LKEVFTMSPVLAHFDYEKKIVFKTDASSNISAGVSVSKGAKLRVRGQGWVRTTPDL
jgi:hypothetical protein